MCFGCGNYPSDYEREDPYYDEMGRDYDAYMEDRIRYPEDYPDDYDDLYIGPPDPVDEAIDTMHALINRIVSIGVYYVPFTLSQLVADDDIPF